MLVTLKKKKKLTRMEEEEREAGDSKAPLLGWKSLGGMERESPEQSCRERRKGDFEKMVMGLELDPM